MFLQYFKSLWVKGVEYNKEEKLQLSKFFRLYMRSTTLLWQNNITRSNYYFWQVIAKRPSTADRCYAIWVYKSHLMYKGNVIKETTLILSKWTVIRSFEKCGVLTKTMGKVTITKNNFERLLIHFPLANLKLTKTDPICSFISLFAPILYTASSPVLPHSL